MFKNENGFSLVELAIAAGLAVALAATAVTVLSGTTANLSSKANGAAGTSSTYNSDVLANASGAAGTNSAPVDNGALGQNWTTLVTGMTIMPWAYVTSPDPSQFKFLAIYDSYNQYDFMYGINNGPDSLAQIQAMSPSEQANYDVSQASKGLITYVPDGSKYYNLDLDGNVIAW